MDFSVPGLLTPATDVVNRGIASLLGSPVDGVADVLSLLGYDDQKPVGGSEWIGEQMQRVGMVTPTRRPLAEELVTFVMPLGGAIKMTAAPQKAFQIGQKAVSENARKMGDAPSEFADFTYILSAPQKQVLEKRLKEMRADRPDRYAVEVSRVNDAMHPNTSRINKDDLPAGLLGDLYEMVYQGKNKIGVAPGKGDRFYLVNLEDGFPDGRKAVGMFAIEDGKIKPATAFPASPRSAENKTRKK